MSVSYTKTQEQCLLNELPKQPMLTLMS